MRYISLTRGLRTAFARAGAMADDKIIEKASKGKIAGLAHVVNLITGLLVLFLGTFGANLASSVFDELRTIQTVQSDQNAKIAVLISENERVLNDLHQDAQLLDRVELRLSCLEAHRTTCPPPPY